MKPIPLSDFPHYLISENGELFTCITLGVNPRLRETPHKKAGYVDDDGYLQYTLARNYKQKRFAAHVLVLLTYKGPRPTPSFEGRHLDGNRLHNHIDNLEWGTRKQNGEDKVRHGNSLRGVVNTKAKITVGLVHKIRAMVESGLSKCEVGRRLGLSNSQVGKIALRRPGGWDWVKDDDDEAFT